MKDERFRKTELAVWVAISGNAALACLKGILGVMTQSQALLADAAHSAAGVAGSSAALVRLRSAGRSQEDTNPGGFDQRAAVTTVLIALLILIAGIEMGFSAVKSLWTPAAHTSKTYALVAIGISLLLKEIMFQYTTKLGQAIESPEIIANGRTHRSDIYSTIVALIGVFGASVANLLDISIFYYLDPIAGIIISLMILRMGYALVKETLHTKKDYVLQQEDADDLLAVVQLIKGVITVDDLKAREQGHYVVVELKISVNPRVSVWEGHEISKKVKQQLMKRFHHISEVLVHVAPYDAGYPYKHATDAELNDLPSVIH
ncbi:cation diffusion facilitator family transporter [Paenibacillus sp. GCM10023248]|uniref:cation diffusion facilitator family transporter n=1 Tax=Bacillales TaxID=1385 RepID=UPI002377D78E|nr:MULTISPECIES: cation diffusion facilitator family transporter [Bacillales]MDD9269824.1 cation diffusion facilitator family transporter [Paenibacillus sp. MAHUQ-63]MDR6881763.1 cation diffusion facilitator family transporter [Bacillus sp. 3255]